MHFLLSKSLGMSPLIDTGADKTQLMPIDAGRLAINFNLLQVAPARSLGVGGFSLDYHERSIIAFLDTGNSLFHMYEVDLLIAAPSPYNTQFPSLLGRDVINNWRMTYDPQANRLEIDVVKDLRKIQVSAGTSSSGNPLP